MSEMVDRVSSRRSPSEGQPAAKTGSSVRRIASQKLTFNRVAAPQFRYAEESEWLLWGISYTSSMV